MSTTLASIARHAVDSSRGRDGGATAQTTFRPILAQLTVDIESSSGEEVCLQAVSYEDRQFSQLLKLGVHISSDTVARYHVFVKAFKRKSDDPDDSRMRRRVAHEFQTLQRAHSAMQSHTDLGVVRPVACYPEHLTIVTEEAPGETLLTQLTGDAVWWPPAATLKVLEEALARVGRWVSAYQAAAPMGDTLSLDETRLYVDRRLEMLVREPRARFTEADRARVLSYVESLSSHVSADDSRSVMAHGDLAMGNILVSESRVTVLDFAMAQHASRLHDIARLYMQIEMLGAKPWFRPRTLRRLQRALLRGFDPELDENAPLFRLMLLLHRVNNFATVSLRPAPFPAGLYDAHIGRLHRRWLAREVASPAPAPPEGR